MLFFPQRLSKIQSVCFLRPKGQGAPRQPRQGRMGVGTTHPCAGARALAWEEGPEGPTGVQPSTHKGEVLTSKQITLQVLVDGVIIVKEKFSHD